MARRFGDLKMCIMKSNQKLSIMFWLFKAKATKDGRAQIYARVGCPGPTEKSVTTCTSSPTYHFALHGESRGYASGRRPLPHGAQNPSGGDNIQGA